MLGFSMRVRPGVAAEDLDQRESRRVIVLLHEVESRDERFTIAALGVGDRRRDEGVDAFRFDVNLDDMNSH